ncbi:MAG: glycosyltransferase, partial [Candidatus Aminicenantales bacterium]
MLISKKVVLITNIPTPYRIPLFNELNTQLKERGFEFKVLFGAISYNRRKWLVNPSEFKFSYEVLPSKRIEYSDPEKVSFTYSGLFRHLRREKPAVIISSGFSIATTKLWFWSWFTSRPFIIWSGDIAREGRASYSFLRILHRKILVKRASGFVAYGSKAKEYLISLGAAAEKIQVGINTVDTHFFREEVRRLRAVKGNSGSRKSLLYVGHLSPRKNIGKLLQVIKKLAQSRSDFKLDIVGDGVEKPELEKFVAENGISDLVRFHGFIQKSQLCSYLAEACCFLFQTDFDIWGQALVEAMAAGLPCVVSCHAGAQHDLIKEGETGFVVDFSEVDEAVDRISYLLDNQKEAMKIGQKASRFIGENLSLEKSA